MRAVVLSGKDISFIFNDFYIVLKMEDVAIISHEYVPYIYCSVRTNSSISFDSFI